MPGFGERRGFFFSEEMYSQFAERLFPGFEDHPLPEVGTGDEEGSWKVPQLAKHIAEDSFGKIGYGKNSHGDGVDEAGEAIVKQRHGVLISVANPLHKSGTVQDFVFHRGSPVAAWKVW